MRTYSTAQEAFYSSLATLRDNGQRVPGVCDPTSVGSRFGTAPRATLELLAFSFTIEDPRARLIKSRARPLDVAFALSNVLWTLRGDRDAAPILFYNPRGGDFTVDGKHFAGALGSRLRPDTGKNQLAEVVRLLQEDSASRRAVILFFDAEDTRSRPRDTPCMISMHFMIREERLWCINSMRSQSALMVMPYDIFLLTMLQEIVSRRLGTECGPFVHVCNSFHVYEDEELLLNAVCEETVEGQWTSMESIDDASEEAISNALEWEGIIRGRLLDDGNSIVDLESAGLTPYWKNVLYLIQAGWKKKHGLEFAKVRDRIGAAFTKHLEQ